VANEALVERFMAWDRRGVLNGWSLTWSHARNDRDGRIADIGALSEVSLMVCTGQPAFERTLACWCGRCIGCGDDISPTDYEVDWHQRQHYVPLPAHRCPPCNAGEAPRPWTPLGQQLRAQIRECDKELARRERLL
jgi:hypothetical protein